MSSRLFVVSLVILAITAGASPQDRWAIANAKTVRLEPRNFSGVPTKITRYLERRGCRIPQTFLSSEPHNVIKGEFAKRRQIDWAVLCSRKGKSSILVFWNGSTRTVSQIATAADQSFLQTIDGAGNVGFSREIRTVGRETILASYSSYGGPKPPPIHHQGIDDIYVEKASVIHYFYRRRWRELQGAD